MPFNPGVGTQDDIGLVVPAKFLEQAINVGVLGRPENSGETHVWYTLLTAAPRLRVDFIPVHYDYHDLAQEMRQEGLPEEFVETILTGWWTTCLEILPGKERARGRW